jgi:serine/threonine protein kinase
MEYCANGDLITAVENFGIFPESIVRAIFVELLDGLAYIHQQDFVHKDIKADNLFLTSEGVLRIGDFGTAEKGDVCTQRSGMTHGYAPPEVYTGKPFSGRAADLFASGVVLYFLASGNLPFRTARRGIDPHYTRLCRGAKSEAPKTQLQGLINNILINDVSTRYTIQEVRQHPWLSGPMATFEERKGYFMETNLV